METRSPEEFFEIPTSAFGTVDSRSEASIAMLWDKAQEIITNTLDCSQNNADENHWGEEVVRLALSWETYGPDCESPKPAFSRVHNM